MTSFNLKTTGYPVPSGGIGVGYGPPGSSTITSTTTPFPFSFFGHGGGTSIAEIAVGFSFHDFPLCAISSFDPNSGLVSVLIVIPIAKPLGLASNAAVPL